MNHLDLAETFSKKTFIRALFKIISLNENLFKYNNNNNKKQTLNFSPHNIEVYNLQTFEIQRCSSRILRNSLLLNTEIHRKLPKIIIVIFFFFFLPLSPRFMSLFICFILHYFIKTCLVNFFYIIF